MAKCNIQNYKSKCNYLIKVNCVTNSIIMKYSSAAKIVLTRCVWYRPRQMSYHHHFKSCCFCENKNVATKAIHTNCESYQNLHIGKKSSLLLIFYNTLQPLLVSVQWWGGYFILWTTEIMNQIVRKIKLKHEHVTNCLSIVTNIHAVILLSLLNDIQSSLALLSCKCQLNSVCWDRFSCNSWLGSYLKVHQFHFKATLNSSQCYFLFPGQRCVS